MNYFQIALRNIKRHKKRSLITILTVCLGFVALGVIGGMLNNIFSRLEEQATVHEKLGHISIAKQGYFENGKLNPEKYLWEKKELDEILRLLEAEPDVIAASPRLKLFGLVSNGKSSSIFISEAIVAEDDKGLQQIPLDGIEKLTSVGLNEKEPNQVAIGEALAASLNLEVGDHLTLLSATKDGIANAIDADIGKVYNTGNPGTNDKFVLMNFAMAQNLYDTDGADRIVVSSNKPSEVPQLEQRLVAKLAAAGFVVEAKTWDEISPSYGKVTQMFGVIFRVLTIIISVIVLLTTLNTMQMVVNERTREIGTMRAIGMLKRNILKLFCYEGFAMSLIGSFLAVPILLGLAFLFKVINITFIPPVASTAIPINLVLKPSGILPLFVLFCAATLLASFLATNKIVKQETIKSLVHA